MINKDLVIIVNGAGTNGGELKALYNHLAKNDDYFVYFPNFLPGGFVGDYFPPSKTSNFIKFIDETVILTNEDWRNVYLIGYSLGAATANVIAAKSKKVTKLVLIAPIIKNPNFHKFFNGLAHSLAYAKNLTRIQKIFYAEFLRRFAKIPKIYLFHVQLYLIYARKYIKKITQKTLIVETLRDEMVKKRSIDLLVKTIKNPDVERYSVDSSHFLLFDKNARNNVINKVALFLEEE